jgi:hypothetical protein
MSDLAALPNFAAGAVLHGHGRDAGEFSTEEKGAIERRAKSGHENSERIALWLGSK